MKALEEENTHSNVARNASKIGATIATNFINNSNGFESLTYATTREPSKESSIEVIDSFNADAF